ncbi:MAG: type IV toxin-antitoxin system AbiEi family antitoxin domain-containing protein [Bacilli bacterium]|nr:type IV toxin-antitoxin system AbiEi family antitoxin domain-containing protein [Bacilli bacterium]
MERMTIKEFKDKSNIEIIESIMEMNNGYITSKELDNYGIHRMYLNTMWKKGIIEKVANGIYIDSKKIEDSYYVFSLSMPNVIYSHMTALYFHGLSIKAPNDKYDITVRKNYNSSHLKNHEVFYVSDDIYELGLTEVETPMGNKVKAYDIERCICDIIRSKNRMDSEHVKHSIREYIKRKDKNLVKLSQYAEQMGIKEEVMNYVEVFYE